jgi:hypothetical protein
MHQAEIEHAKQVMIRIHVERSGVSKVIVERISGSCTGRRCALCVVRCAVWVGGCVGVLTLDCRRELGG